MHVGSWLGKYMPIPDFALTQPLVHPHELGKPRGAPTRGDAPTTLVPALTRYLGFQEYRVHKAVQSSPQKENLVLQVPIEGTGEGLDTSSQKPQPGEMLGKILSKTNLKMQHSA